MSDINSAIIERLERVVDTLQENSVKMGQLLAVHNEKKPRLKKKRKYKSKCNEGLDYPKSEKEKDSYLPFKVCYDGAQEYVLYGKSEADIKIQLRKIYRPENHKKIYVKRLYPNQVIRFYYDLRMKALKNQ